MIGAVVGERDRSVVIPTRALGRRGRARAPILTRRDGGSRVVELLLPPLVAFVLARALVWAAAASAGFGWPGARDLGRHDSFLYLSIAHHGYTLFACDRVGGWCGNAGWFPLFALLLAPFLHAGISGLLAGSALAAALQLATLVLLWGLLGGRRTTRALLALLAAAVFPGAVYYAAVFPLSLLTLLALAALALASRGRHGAAAGLVALCAVTHPLGLGAAVAVALPEALARRPRIAAAYLGAGAAGAAAIAVAQRLAVGHFNAYLLIQRHYGHGGTSPVGTFRYAKEALLTFLRDPHRLDLVPQLQLLLVALFVCAVATASIAAWRDLTPIEVSAATFTVCVWAAPLLLGGVSLYRSDAALLPGLLLARRLPAALLAVFVVAATPLAFEMSRLFFESVLA